MSYRIALCDDDLTQAQSLNRQVAVWARQTSAQCSVEIFPSGEALGYSAAGRGNARHDGTRPGQATAGGGLPFGNGLHHLPF